MTPAAQEQDAEARFALFAALLALALVLHQAWWDGFQLISWHGAVVLAAFAVLVRPGSVLRFCLLLGLEVVAVAHDMPGAGSHTVLAAVCAATVLGAAAWCTIASRRAPRGGELFEQVAPFLRLSVLILYAAAALAKLNPGFFDPAVSCGAALAPRIVWFDPALLDVAWVRTAAIYGTVGVEIALPILLALRRTRSAGLALGVGFHVVLAFAGNVPFSSLLLALYIAFLPAGWVRCVAARVHLTVPRRASLVAFALLCCGWVLGGLAEAADPVTTQARVEDVARFVVLAVGVAAAGAAWAARGRPAWAAPAGGRQTARLVLVMGLTLLLLNALSPYMGLKTESAFTMYSNLQTEERSWNHAFIPQAVQVFGQQDRLVRVVASNDASLLRRTRGGTRIVGYELERYLRGHPDVRVATLPPTPQPGPGGTLRSVVDRVAKFRDVRPVERRGC